MEIGKLTVGFDTMDIQRLTNLIIEQHKINQGLTNVLNDMQVIDVPKKQVIHGDILEAARVLLRMAVSNNNSGKKYSTKEILAEWDRLRGNDSFENYIRKDKLLNTIKEM